MVDQQCNGGLPVSKVFWKEEGDEMIEGLTSAGLPRVLRVKDGKICYDSDRSGKKASLSPSGYPIRQKEIDLCKEWIKKFCIPRKMRNSRYGSYGLKHLVEGYYGEYISNGAFIAAAEESGYEVLPDGDNSPNAGFRFWINIAGINPERSEVPSYWHKRKIITSEGVILAI